MIGGTDTVVAGSGPGDEGAFIVSALRRSWPDLVVQDAAVLTAVAADDPSIARMSEFFVYRSRTDFESWEAEGASEANGDTMIHVILGPESTTLVTEREGSKTYEYAGKLRRDVEVHRLVAELEAKRARFRARPPHHPAPSLDKRDRQVKTGERRAPLEEAVNH